MRFLASLVFLLTISSLPLNLQAQCTTLGQTPSTAFPVCGTTVFTQSTVPLCSTNDLYVPGCSGSGNANYANKNPFFYRFTCFTAGTLSFLITPLAANEDYDWQLYDITGHSPEDIFTNNSLVVTGNWAGTYGPTGASSTGVSFIQCASVPGDNKPTFAKSPNLIQGHTYLLMVSHYSDTQSGYTLSFSGGSAVITDPKEPEAVDVKVGCDGATLRVRLNKKMKCSSITAAGSEFSLSPAVTTVTNAVGDSCSLGFDTDEIILTLAAPLTNNNYQLIINPGSDGNSVLDNCDRPIPVGTSLPFVYNRPVPIFADSLASPGCAPRELTIYFPKRILCSTIKPDGQNFTVSGPGAMNVVSATGNCVAGQTETITVKLAGPLVNRGTYTLYLQAGVDGSTIIDECGINLPDQSLSFSIADTVNADFSQQTLLGCRFDTLRFAHNGTHQVNSWQWKLNNNPVAGTQQYNTILPASGSYNITLTVSNGTCADTLSKTVVLDNEVRASFDIPSDICPEDQLSITNTSRGLIDQWQWNFGVLGASNLKDPLPLGFPPNNNEERVYKLTLLATNLTLGCTDSASRQLKVFDNCYIAVPSAFTPNGDGLNDYLYPNNAIKAINLEFKVYNRWGQLVFATTNWQQQWDGKINGQPQSAGTYVWFLRYTHRDTGKQVFQKGTTILIR